MNDSPNHAILPHTGAFIGAAHHFTCRVYFEDTDLSGVVYHANYLRFMERARSDMLAVAGIDQRAAWDAGEGVYAVRGLTIDYERPARLGDVLMVRSQVTEVRAASCSIDQTIWRGDERITRATVAAAFLGANGRPKRQPQAWRALFEQLINRGGEWNI